MALQKAERISERQAILGPTAILGIAMGDEAPF